jgi:hypothetical protein
MVSKRNPKLASWINQKGSNQIKMMIKRTKCLCIKVFSFLRQEDVLQTFNRKNLLIHSSFLMELISPKANKLFNLSFSKKKRLVLIKEKENLQKF